MASLHAVRRWQKGTPITIYHRPSTIEPQYRSLGEASEVLALGLAPKGPGLAVMQVKNGHGLLRNHKLSEKLVKLLPPNVIL